MNVLGRIFLNSRKERRKDGVFLWDVEELTFLIKFSVWDGKGTQFVNKYDKLLSFLR